MLAIYCLLLLLLFAHLLGPKCSQHLQGTSAGLGSAVTVVGALEPLFQEGTTPGIGGGLGRVRDAL